MAIETFQNNFSTTLNGAINDSVTSITVNAAAGDAAQFRIKVDDEIMIVTAGGTGTSWTVTRGAESTTAASHSSGATVTRVLTEGAILQLIKDMNRTGTYANLPATSDAVQGMVYHPTDSPYSKLIFNGTGWDHYLGGAKVTPFSNAGMTVFGTITTGASTSGGAFLLEDAVGTGSQLDGYRKTAPSTPWTLTVAFTLIGYFVTDYVFGVGVYDSSNNKLEGIETAASTPNIRVSRWTNTSTFGSLVVTKTKPANAHHRYQWFRVEDNGTNLKFYLSSDGDTFTEISSTSRTAHLTPDNLALWILSNNSTHAAAVTVLGWDVT